MTESMAPNTVEKTCTFLLTLFRGFCIHMALSFAARLLGKRGLGFRILPSYFLLKM